MVQRIFLIILFVFSVFSCEKKQPSSGVFVDIGNQTNISMLDIFKNIKIIPLETTSESLIKSISKVIAIDDRYYIFDKEMSQILIFDDNGIFFNKISNRGNGPGEYIHISDIDIYNDTITILSPLNKSIFNYDLDGVVINQKRLPDIERTYVYLKHINADAIIFWTADENNRMKFYSKVKDIIYKENFPEEHDLINTFIDAVFPYGNILSRSTTDDVYKYDLDGNIEVAYSWDFGKYSNIPVNKEEQPNSSNMLGAVDYAKKLFSSEIVDYIFMSQGGNSKYLYTQIGRKNSLINIFHNKENLENIVFTATKEGAKLNPVFWNDSYIIGLEIEIENTESMLPSSILDTENIIKRDQIGHDDNPILIIYEFK